MRKIRILLKKMNINFILDYDFDGDINKLIVAIQNGEAIKYNGIPYPVRNAYPQGKQVVLPLFHKNMVIDLNDAYNKLDNSPIIKITINIRR